MARPQHEEDDFSEDSQFNAEDSGRNRPRSGKPLTFADMSVIAADIKATFSAAITDLKSNILVLSDKMETAEAKGKHRDKALHRLEKVADTHAAHFIEMSRHLEDLDNRGRRCNVRVRGIPESVENDQIIPALQRVFNSLLERQEDTAIEFVRAHRALRPRGPDDAPPRDVVCCLQNFQLKEDIMRKARRNDHIVFNGANIMLYQDLSQITLKNRRAMCPLLEQLREREIKYTWRFPFALVVTVAGKQHTLRTPTDLPYFCEALNLEPMALPDWYQEYTLPPLSRSPPDSPFSTPDKQKSKKQKQGRGGNSQAGTPAPRHTPARGHAYD